MYIHVRTFASSSAFFAAASNSCMAAVIGYKEMLTSSRLLKMLV